MSGIEKLLGPRVPPSVALRDWRYLLPSGLLALAAILLAVSWFLPYWHMTLHAPQYPRGLHVTAWLNRLEGDIREIDNLNHYIGMRPLNDAARLERQLSWMLVAALALLTLGAIFIHNRRAAWLTIPAILFPAGFLVDLQVWLATFGTQLDPRAPLSTSIKPFVPPVLGEGLVGQFRTVAVPGAGWYLALAASLTVLAGLWFHRRAYKPLVDALRAGRDTADARRDGPAASSPGADGARAGTCVDGAEPGRPPAEASTCGRRAASHGPELVESFGSTRCLLPWLTAAGLALASAPGAGADAQSPRSAELVQSLIGQAQAGQCVRVPGGVYQGQIVIDRPLVLVADGRVVIDARGVGDVVRITAPDVTLRGFELRGTGDDPDRPNAGVSVAAARTTVEDNVIEDCLLGISLNNAPQCVIRGNRIRGKDLDVARRGDAIRLWNSHDCLIESNRVERGRDVVVWYSTGIRLVGNRVRHGRYGMHFMYASGSTLEGNELSDNSVGVFLMYSRDITLCDNLLAHNRGPSGYGLGLKDMDDVRARGNVLLANRVGIYLDNSPFRSDGVQEFRENVLVCNDVGLAFLPSVRGNRFADNAFLENIEQVAVLGTGQFQGNDFTVAGRGNFWSDYAGFDADGDGLGDVPYRAVSLFENLMDREPKLRLFLYSPVQQAIELAARAFPVVRPQAKLTDSAPLMRPVEPRAAALAPPDGRRRPGASLALGTIIVALAAWLVGRRALPVGAADRACTPIGSAGLDTRQERQDGAAAAPASEPLLVIRDLRKSFGRHVAIDGLTLELWPGQALALWGPNGAGKTTIIKCLLGLLPCRGQVRIGGADARREGKAARRCVGYVSQELAFYDDLSARELVALFARLRRIAPSRVPQVLEEVGLTEHARKRVAALSGGMKQRLALAIALLGDPPLLLLDEPTSNLDAAARRHFLALLLRLKQAGKTILFSTHRPEEVAYLADRVILLERGRAVRDGPATLLNEERGLWVTLRLPVVAERRERARDVLAAAGFDVCGNHAALLVRVPPTRKASPLQALAAAGIAVDDFDLESEAGRES